MHDVVTFGEAMIRLTPPHFQRLEQARALDLNVAGSEFNVAAGVTRFGLNAAWVSRLPRNPLGYLIRARAREFGVDCSHIVWSEEGRVGIYFIEFGAAPRPTSILYDRAGSAISMVRPGEINWRDILGKTEHFHVTGITPALSESAAQVTLEALKAARHTGCTVSYDLNYRAKIWSPMDAKITQEPLMPFVDILMTNLDDPRIVFGIDADRPERLATRLAERYGFKTVAVTLKKSPSLVRTTWTAIAYQDGEIHEDRVYEVDVVDSVGAGDSFAAGFIAGWKDDHDAKKGIQYGNAFAALKHTSPGDLNWNTREEVETLLQGPGLKTSR